MAVLGYFQPGPIFSAVSNLNGGPVKAFTLQVNQMQFLYRIYYAIGKLAKIFTKIIDLG